MGCPPSCPLHPGTAASGTTALEGPAEPPSPAPAGRGALKLGCSRDMGCRRKLGCGMELGCRRKLGCRREPECRMDLGCRRDPGCRQHPGCRRLPGAEAAAAKRVSCGAQHPLERGRWEPVTPRGPRPRSHRELCPEQRRGHVGVPTAPARTGVRSPQAPFGEETAILLRVWFGIFCGVAMTTVPVTSSCYLPPSGGCIIVPSE